MKTSQWFKNKTSPAVQTIGQLRMALAKQSNSTYPAWAKLTADCFGLSKFPLPADEQLYAHYLNGRTPLSVLAIEREDAKVS